MSYSKNIYYPTENLTIRNQRNTYNAYKEFFENNETIKKYFTVSSNDNVTTLYLIPIETYLQNYVIGFKFAYGDNARITMFCETFDIPSSSTYIYQDIYNTDIPLTIIETNNFIMVNTGINLTRPVGFFICSGVSFNDEPRNKTIFLTYYYSSEQYVHQGSGGKTYASRTGNMLRLCNADTISYRLTRLSSFDSRYDIIFTDIYCIDGGKNLPSWGTKFKIGNDSFLMIFSNVCVRLEKGV